MLTASGNELFYYTWPKDATHNYEIDFLVSIQVSQVTSGPRRGPTFNNRWWNDRRSWNLRTTNSREKASPKGANHIQPCSCSPPSGTIERVCRLSAGFIPFGHSTSGYWKFAPFGDGITKAPNDCSLVLPKYLTIIL